MIEKLYELVGDMGGYEADFLYIASFIRTFAVALKDPQWSFVGLRSAFESYTHDPMLRDIMRRCFTLGGRTIIGGADDAQDSRMDKALGRLLVDKEGEASFLFQEGSVPSMSEGFLGLPVERRTRIVRFLMQSVFDTPSAAITGVDRRSSPVVGFDADGNRYFLLVDTTLEVGCWRERLTDGRVELIATSTDVVRTVAATLRNGLNMPERTKNNCIYCRKRVVDSPVACMGCQVGACHYKCLPAAELSGHPWCCSAHCRQALLVTTLQQFVEEIEPQQKAAMRKRRRLNGELQALQINAKDFGTDSARRTSRGRAMGAIDYSFRDYDRMMSDAIRKSERRSDYASSEEEIIEPTRPMSREERMALRENRQSSAVPVQYVQAEPESEESEEVVDEQFKPSVEESEPYSAQIQESEHVEPMDDTDAKITDEIEEPQETGVVSELAPALPVAHVEQTPTAAASDALHFME